MSAEFLRTVRCEPVILAGSDRGEGNFLVTPQEREEYVQLEVVAEGEDGILYDLSRLLADSEKGRPC